MAGYIVLPIKRDPIEVEEAMTEVQRLYFPDLVDSDGDPVTILKRAASVVYADLAELATSMAEEAFRYFGRSLAELPPADDLPAVGSVTFTAVDTAGPYVVPEGTEVAGRSATGDPVGFVTTVDGTIPNGSLTVSVGVVASIEGAAGNDISGVAEPTEYLDFVASAAFDAPTSGGQDRQDDSDYLDELHDELQVSSPEPIQPDDFAVLARRFGAYRAVAIDRLNPADGTTDNDAMVAVAAVDETGEAVDAPIKTAIQTGLEGFREVGFSVPLFDPTYTTIAVSFTATSYPGWDPADVETAAEAAVADRLDPAKRGTREDTGEIREWLNDTKVRYSDVLAWIKGVESVWHVDTLALGVARAVTASAATDVVTSTAHGYADADPVAFAGLTGGAPLVNATTYYVRDVTANTFKVAATPGGAAIDLTTDITAGTVAARATADITLLGYAPLTRPGAIDGTVTAPA